jgi:hypothetical protein
MLKTATILIFIITACSPSFADSITCDSISKKAETEQNIISPVAGYQVIGDGRLYFHFAPDEKCRNKDVFVIPGDQLIAYTEYKGWFSVMYLNPKTGKDFEGWVQSKRLKFTGTMGTNY